MKLAVNNSSMRRTNNISFKGHNSDISDKNRVEHKFYLPYDSEKYDAQLELCGFEEVKGRWQKIKGVEPKTETLPPEGVKIPEAMLYTDDGTATGYRFILTDKNNSNNKIYKIDSGLQTNPNASRAEDTYALLLPNRAVLTVNGLTKQVMPDICFPGYRLSKTQRLEFVEQDRTRALSAIRTHGNKLGGNLAGIIKMLPTWKKEGYTKIVGTPFTKDEVSSHLYWTETPYQIANSMGTTEDFKTLQKELFKNGMSFIADGALVNQGLQGTMFRDVLKNGTESPFFHWFKAPGLMSSKLNLGVIPANKEARENFRFRMVNAPYNIKDEYGSIIFEKNPKYNSKQLSYVQLYDKRLVTDEEVQSNELLKGYSKTNTSNAYDITSHDDITQLLSFEVTNPEAFKENAVRTIKSFPKDERSFENPQLVESLLSFDNFSLTTKDKGGVDLWDGNMDIAKLNFYKGNTDQSYIDRFTDPYEKAAKIDELTQATYQVQDFALKSAKYWTKLVADTQIEYAANVLRIGPQNTNPDAVERPTVEAYDKAIKEAVADGKLPETALRLNKNKIKNVLSGTYNLPKLNVPRYLRHKESYIQSQVMEHPFEAIELSPDLTAILASPHISKRANKEDELFLPRHELNAKRAVGEDTTTNKYTKNYDTADVMLNKEMTNYVTDVVELLESKLTSNQRFFDYKEHVTDFGVYALSALLPDIVKFGVVKAFNPKADISYDEINGIVDYSKAETDKISLKSIGVTSNAVNAEARDVINALRRGLSNISDEDKENLANTILTRIKNVSKQDYRIANALVNETGSGLGWRIDAAKDIGNIDAIRTGNDDPKALFEHVTDFWKKFNDTIKAENPHAFTTAEITDLGDIIQDNPEAEYQNYVDAETKFLSKSGLNNTANYMYFYSLLRDMFAPSAETGKLVGEFGEIKNLHEKLNAGWPLEPNKHKVSHGFLYQYTDDSIANSYTFVGNHDKPRVLHVLALDMKLFHSDFTDKKHKDTAVEVLNLKSADKLDCYKLSGKAIAMGKRLLDAFKTSGAILDDKQYALATPETKKRSDFLKSAIASLAGGNFKGKDFKADAFGTRDFRHALKHVFEEAEYLGYKSENKEKDLEYKNEALKNILEPAMDKMETIYKMLVTLPGSPTDFVGDKEGASGYETKSNNDFQQNRNVVPFEWVNKVLNNEDITKKDNKEFVNDYYNNMTKIGALRTKKELSALTTGNTVALPMQTGYYEDPTQLDDKGKPKKIETPVSATYRYDDKGSEVICLYTTDGANSDCKAKMNRHCVNLDRVELDNFSWKEGIKGGLKVGTKFRNVNGTATYVVDKDDNGAYFLKREPDGFYTAISILPEDKNTAILYKENPKAYEPQLIFPNMNYSIF